MSRLVKDYVEIGDCTSLDALIARLAEIRDSLPEPTEAEVKLRGDDIFGRHLCVGFLRPQTAEEAECEARYEAAYEQSRQRELARLQDELGRRAVPPRRRHLRAA